MGNPQCANLAKSVLLKHKERQRFDSADWAMSLPMNRDQAPIETSAPVAPKNDKTPMSPLPVPNP
ncbi:hypothetical protein ACHHYP_00563 [Achlya hypogyna]|uniref:Uncharacterized protein n=1 Tax=Achlya hypogyna TaxID=1202772 RepID=A0A1V9ZUB5_ACHHY|nr:hypothetical protein ACHHYP_00563 [Achlya hypogyna]